MSIIGQINAWSRGFRLLATEPLGGEHAFISELAERTREILSEHDFEVATDGMTITISGLGRFKGRTSVMLPVFMMRAPVPLDERLSMVLGSHGRRLQELLTSAYGEPWPTASAGPHVSVTPDMISLWWGGSTEKDAVERLRPISRIDIGI
jgi:hypothetical protein